VSKGVITGPDQIHVSYVHSPIRYAWDFQHQYLRESGLNKGLKGWLAKYLLHKIRIWDYRTAAGVNHFIGNSRFIARRINKVYGRQADVIYPPVNT
ncbi:glycosyltransferase family 4 protein, partial [Escherichia coli]